MYTRTGDKGSTSLYNGERRSKADPVFEALGHTDELNAQLGVAREHCQQLVDLAELCSQLTVIQSRLLDVGSAIATPIDTSSAAKLSRVTFADAHVVALEKWIDAMDDTLPALRNFILPVRDTSRLYVRLYGLLVVVQSGGLAAAHLHVARTVCRRAERAVVPLVADGHVPPEVGRYLNRYSCMCVTRVCSSNVGTWPYRLSDFFFVAARFASAAANAKEVVYKKQDDATTA